MMFELRCYVDEQEVVNQLIHLDAKYCSQYAFTDEIYHPKNGKYNLNEQFLRLRLYTQTAWEQKLVELTYKVKNISSVILKNRKWQFNNKEETLPHLLDYELAFMFKRNGYEYKTDKLHIFLEKIDGLPFSAEILSKDHKAIEDFFAKIPSAIKIQDSVPRLIEKTLIN